MTKMLELGMYYYLTVVMSKRMTVDYCFTNFADSLLISKSFCPPLSVLVL